VTTILGIETSCDETSAAVVVDGHSVLSNIVSSQVDLHAKFGGVVPEIAARAHLEQINLIIQEALDQASVPHHRIDAVAVTNRPGLIGALLIGLSCAKALAWAWHKPLVAVDHLKAHLLSPAIELGRTPFPLVSLVVSGGHTELYLARDYDDLELLGGTTDDAAGEAFDKVANILGLGYPGGPAVDRAARQGNPEAVRFPRTWLGPDSLDFSYSGLKTAVLYHVHGPGKTSGGLEKLGEQEIADLAASFQAAAVEPLVRKTMLAVARTGVETVFVGGGVAANSALRSQMQNACSARNLTLHLAPLEYCTDNGAMVAALGYHLLKRGQADSLDLGAFPN
jgi:N6-L-threonylcarbamoyladenine synthase